MKRILAVAVSIAMILSVLTCLSVSAAGAHTHDTIEFKEWRNAEKLPDEAGNYCLAVDVTLSSRWFVPEGEVNLCLNGHNITGVPNLFTAIYVYSGSELSIFDCSGGKGTVSAKYTIECRYGTFTLNGGTVTGTSYGIYNNHGGKVTVNGGTVSSGSYGIYNYSDQYMSSGAEVTVNGGSISGNGYGIYNENSGDRNEYRSVAVTVNGGSIYGSTNGIRNQYGTVSVNGGAIDAFDYGIYSMGLLNLSGDAKISGYNADIFLFRKYITVTGRLENAAPYAIEILDFPEEGDGVFTDTAEADISFNDPKRFKASAWITEQGYSVIKVNGQLRFAIAPDSYTVTYNPGVWGLGDSFFDIKVKGTDLILSDKVFTRFGYEQIGWATENDGEKVYELGGIYSDDMDLSLYPAWKACTYSVVYHDGDTVTKGSYTFNEGLTLPVPEKIGYCFLGWYKNAKYEGNAVTEIGRFETGDKEFWAKWEIHEHKWDTDNWARDTVAHWHACLADGCDITEKSQMNGYGPHEYNEEEVCIVCGARPYLPGDLNGDGIINSTDAVLLKRKLAGFNDSNIIEAAADYNGDGDINSTDSVLLLRELAGLN